MATVTITSKGKQLPVKTDFKFASGALAYFNDTQVKNSKPSGVEWILVISIQRYTESYNSIITTANEMSMGIDRGLGAVLNYSPI